MDYLVNIKTDALIFLNSLDHSLRQKVEKQVLALKYEPISKGKYIGSLNSGVVFYEKRIFLGSGFRVYYSVLPEQVTILQIQYLGTVNVHKIGDKKTQRRDIADLEKYR
jgi:putative component of toxin-antitoxin plasmid stabilization module